MERSEPKLGELDLKLCWTAPLVPPAEVGIWVLAAGEEDTAAVDVGRTVLVVARLTESSLSSSSSSETESKTLSS